MLYQKCSLQALYIGPLGPARKVSIDAIHYDIDDGISIPRTDHWFELDLHVRTEAVSISDPEGLSSTFMIFYTENSHIYPPSEAIANRLPGKQWHGELLIFREAVFGTRLVNLRSEDSDRVWKAVERFLDKIEL
ncbi:hypothetical protein BV25DRAFT_1921444 [Artomyces pyxidatus]|uniref:Uncharacterized protein n=1 Tax=Artomyces pyxidatus TaxID=48021 RepID=A0ACB8SI44_9AGAM|nr:hypothetical protein BV25DRAFT_1921444 [Artomyces pyxidatus]